MVEHLQDPILGLRYSEVSVLLVWQSKEVAFQMALGHGSVSDHDEEVLLCVVQTNYKKFSSKNINHSLMFPSLFRKVIPTLIL